MKKLFCGPLFTIAVCLAALSVTACQLSNNKQTEKSNETGTSVRETLPTDSSSSTQPTQMTQSTDPTKIASGTLLGNLNDGCYVRFSGGPLFTYNQAEDVLIAYCYEEGSSHLPYNLTYSAKNDGSVNQFLIPEFNLTVYYYFDTDYGIWRLFDYNPENPPAEGGNSEINEWNRNEFRVYYDTADILTYADHLYRFSYAFCTPRYREYDEMLYYKKGDQKEIFVDMDGDGIQEQFLAAPYDWTPNGSLYDFSTYMNGEKEIDVQMVDSLIGIYVVDISKDDSYKEVICEFEYEDGYTRNFIIRYDGSQVKFEVFSCIYDIPGNGSILVGNGQFLQTVVAKKEYSVDSSFTFTQEERLFDTDINVTSTAPVQVKFDVDGEYVDGILEKGTKIQIYQVDYVSKAFFVTETGEKGLLTVDGLTVLPDGIGTWECFDGFVFGG